MKDSAMVRLLALLLATLIPSTLAYSRGSDEWTGWGGSIYNDRSSDSRHISSSSLNTIDVHCKIPHHGGVSATPVVSNGVAYYPTYGGTFVAMDYTWCQIKWETNVTSIITDFAPLTVLQKAVVGKALFLASRTSPQIDTKTNVLYFGTQLNALVVALDVGSGAHLGTHQINPHPAAIITLSPTLHNNILYIGAASGEELVAGFVPGYPCCSFVGNAAALTFDRKSGTWHTVWNLDMLPRIPVGTQPSTSTWSGVGVWGSQPAIDISRGHVFFATGNVYTTPPEYTSCTDDTFDPSSTNADAACLPPRVYQDSVLALDLLSGSISWIKRFGPLDVWNLACGLNGTATDPTSCPGIPGPDYDFGMAPTFLPDKGKHGCDIVIVGQKSGYLYSLAADTGEVEWATLTSPGGNMGGLSWGIAADDSQVYFSGTNSLFRNFPLLPLTIPWTMVNSSIWGAASILDGRILWETPASDGMLAYAPPTAVGDLVFAGRVEPLGPLASGDGPMVVLDKGTGKVLLEMPLNGTLRGGIAVQDQFVMFGTGYKGSDGFLYVLKVSDGRS